jgi:putative Ca2+/H+ antiporter (TMEM165/GDT1 family)
MDAFLTSTALVALAEIGDKTQLLAILLATRFRKPLPIIAGIFAATIANHFLAASLGHGIAGLLDSLAFRVAIALSFIAMGLWTLVPDKMDEAGLKERDGASVFITTLIAFFLVEMGDKTQIATVALGARFANVYAVTAGTTVGMMLANVPAVYLGEALIARVRLSLVRAIAASLFILLGLWMLGSTLGWW